MSDIPVIPVTLQTPRPPNFIRTLGGVAVPIAELDDKTLRQIGRHWTSLLLLKAQERRGQSERAWWLSA